MKQQDMFSTVPDVAVKGTVIAWPEDSVAKAGDRISIVSWSGHIANCEIVRSNVDAVTVQWALGVQATVSMRTGRGLGAIKQWRIDGETRAAIKRGVTYREKERR